MFVHGTSLNSVDLSRASRSINYGCSCSFSQFSERSNQTLSVLTFTPTKEDEGELLTCRSENPLIAESGIEDGWLLVVHCKWEEMESQRERKGSTFNLPLYWLANLIELIVHSLSRRSSTGDTKHGTQFESEGHKRGRRRVL